MATLFPEKVKLRTLPDDDGRDLHGILGGGANRGPDALSVSGRKAQKKASGQKRPPEKEEANYAIENGANSMLDFRW